MQVINVKVNKVKEITTKVNYFKKLVGFKEENNVIELRVSDGYAYDLKKGATWVSKDKIIKDSKGYFIKDMNMRLDAMKDSLTLTIECSEK
ncbi:hypothetical protein [Tenacibaculum phage Larrie]|nr:hypothetical protein [Tenacibaculum phage Larrie]